MNEHISAKTMVLEPTLHAGPPAKIIKAIEVAVIVAETLLVSLALAGHDWQMLILVHLGMVALLVALVVGLERSKVASGGLKTFALLTFAGGPIGAAAALAGEQQIWQPRGDALDRWYETIAPSQSAAVTLVDMIIDGRLVREESRLPRPYDTLLETGTVHEKQALLAYLAIENDQKFVDVALALALRSADQRVRVQAAAVAAHIKSRNRRTALTLKNSLSSVSPFPALKPNS